MAVKQKGKATLEEVVADTTINGVQEEPTTTVDVDDAPVFTGSGLGYINELQRAFGVYNSIDTAGSIDSLLNTKPSGNGQSVLDYIANEKINLKMTVLDKAVDGNLLYSFPIVYRECGDHVKYTPILLTGTGRKPLTAHEYSIKAAAATRNPDLKVDVYTYASALNDVIDTKAIAALKSVLDGKKASSKKLLTFNGKIANTDIPEEDAIAILKKTIADIAVEYGVDDGFNKNVGLNIGKLRQDGNVRFRYAIETIPGGTKVDKLGSPVRADFILRLFADTGANAQNWKLNEGALTEEIIAFTGYFTGVPNYVAEHRDQMGNVVPGGYVISPRLIITSIRAMYPDLSSSILAIATSYLLFTEKQYIKIIHDTMTPDNNPGVFNLLGKWAADAKGRITPINLFDKNLKEQERMEIIDSVFKGTPIISIDAKLFSTDFNNLEILKASKTDSSAQQDIINATAILTDGLAKIETSPVFAIQKLPSGYYYDSKNNQKDIRDWEIERFLARDTMGDDPSGFEAMMRAMVLDAGVASYGNKIDSLASYFKDSAFIDGEIDRITIDPAFLGGVLGGLRQAGLFIAGDERYVFRPTNVGFNHNFVNGYNFNNINVDLVTYASQPQGYNRYIFHNPFLVQGYN